MSRVLVVDDEPQLARLLVINLKARRYDVDCAQDGGTALEAVAAGRPDAVLPDLGLPDMDGKHRHGFAMTVADRRSADRCS